MLERSADARASLLELHLPYARTVAATYFRRRRHNEVGFDDYLQSARLGMLEAFDRFEPTHGVQFRTFASRRMHGAILDGLERSTEKQQQIAFGQALRDAKARSSPDRTWMPLLSSSPVGEAVCRLLQGSGMVDVTDAQPPVCVESVLESLERAELNRRLLQAIELLRSHHRTVIRYHYLQGHRFDEIGEVLSLTKGRVSQIHRQALEALRVLIET